MKTLGIGRKIRFECVIGFICVILAYVRYKDGWDPLSDKYLGSTGYLWSHFVMYFMMGYIDFLGDKYPYAYAFGLSAVWELTELAIGVGTNSVQYWTSGGPQGQMKDIIFNMTGLFVGRQIQKVFPCRLNNCPKKLVDTYEAMAVTTTLVSVFNLLLRN
ncbi:unnamed protein product [Ectocarpus sp. 13 AM-2016]